jgi:hypothetical protein
MKLLSHTIRVLLLVLLAVAVSGCRSVEKTSAVRTEYKTVYQRDSVYVDCTDTLYVVERGDTVRIHEKQTVREYRFLVFRDTLKTTDTMVVEKKTSAAAAEGTAKKPKRWAWFLAGAVTALVLAFVIRILIKIYLHK